MVIDNHGMLVMQIGFYCEKQKYKWQIKSIMQEMF